MQHSLKDTRGKNDKLRVPNYECIMRKGKGKVLTNIKEVGFNNEVSTNSIGGMNERI